MRERNEGDMELIRAFTEIHLEANLLKNEPLAIVGGLIKNLTVP